MAEISAKDVMKLREQTGAGMMDCKKALLEAEGDFERAADILRERGIAKAAKRAGKIAAEGIVYALVEGKTGVLVEVNCESDFVANGAKFHEIADTVAKQILKNGRHRGESLRPPFRLVRDERIPRDLYPHGRHHGRHARS